MLLAAGSLPALLIWISIIDKTGGQYLKSSVHDIGEGAGALAKYQVDTVNLALVNAVFEMKRVDIKQNKEVDTEQLYFLNCYLLT